MRSGYDEHLTQKVLQDVGWPEKRAGIFTLDRKELEDLGDLTSAERAVVRTAINTRDVYPYAAVPPNDGEVLLRMTRDPEAGITGLHAPFPEGMPHLQAHLERFRPLLEHKVTSYNEADVRPLWSVHRPKPYITEREPKCGAWADYCVTKRWGAGESLIVGLAPSGAAPKSGIYSLLPPVGVSAPYVSAVLNATAVQELADTLPPGVLRTSDLEEIGVPLLRDSLDGVTHLGEELADLVRDFVLADSKRFLTLPEQLKSDVAMAAPDLSQWTPESGPTTSWGHLKDLGWVSRIESSGTANQKIESVDVQHELFGVGVRVRGHAGGTLMIVLDETDEDLANALRFLVLGAAEAGARLGTVPDLRAPIEAVRLSEQYERDIARFAARLDRYRSLRASIDSIVDAAM
jgi:hypothetical protein